MRLLGDQACAAASVTECQLVRADVINGAAHSRDRPGTKRCTKCGVEKPRSEYYIKRRLKNGGVISEPACKECAKRRIAQRRSKRHGVEYKARRHLNHTCTRCGHLVAYHTDGVCLRCNPKLSPRAREICECKLEGMWEWRNALRRAISTFRRRQRSRSKLTDPWHRRFVSAAAGIRRRRPTFQARVDRTIRRAHPATWESSLMNALVAWFNRSYQRKRMRDPWFKKFSTMCRNWRRKALGR